ncbi:hypothetical protein LOK49_LG09G01945 [Camellia lanceoleosa]|uniref:Uncharacterized protein n=1 Tax=Camellia lanceoleosa TaxID=1840588 RepID=A0ACC0GI58_9ERIC|nr:hypothetical protein LOK49_LG09G01945 [Camellia lanceoleosa]
MVVHREGQLMRNIEYLLCGPRLAVVIVIGVAIRCIFAFLYPYGLFDSSPIHANRIDKSDLQVTSTTIDQVCKCLDGPH